MTDLLDGLVGGLGGGVLVGTAQLVTYWFDKRAHRGEMERQVIPDLLADLHYVETELPMLSYSEAPAGSPLSYGERLKNARPLLGRLSEATAQRVPLLRDSRIRDGFSVLRELCTEVAGPNVDVEAVGSAINLTRGYIDGLRSALEAAYHGQKTPALPATPELPTRSTPAQHRAVQ